MADGAAELAAFGRQLQAAGDKLNRAAGDSLEKATGPVESAIKDATGQLPQRGGLADAVAGSLRVDGQAHMTGSGAAARMTVSSRYDLATLDSGVVHHQTYGRGRSVTQSIPAAAGFVTDAVTREADRVNDRLADDVDAAIRKAIT